MTRTALGKYSNLSHTHTHTHCFCPPNTTTMLHCRDVVGFRSHGDRIRAEKLFLHSPNTLKFKQDFIYAVNTVILRTSLLGVSPVPSCSKTPSLKSKEELFLSSSRCWWRTGEARRCIWRSVWFSSRLRTNTSCSSSSRSSSTAERGQQRLGTALGFSLKQNKKYQVNNMEQRM